MKFINEAKAIQPAYQGQYSYDQPSKYLFQVSRFLQKVISQAGTYLFTGKFHRQECGIHKCEGGCNLPGVGELVLGNDFCYFDSYYHEDKKKKESAGLMANLISKIVLEWNPEEPLFSMIRSAADFIGIPAQKFADALEESKGNSRFGGNALADFFDWNPFSPAPIDRDYERYVMTTFGGKTDAEVTQEQTDADLGKDLLERINDKIRSVPTNGYRSALCCRPSRREDKLHFWINTGRCTQIDGWKTQEDIETFLASDGIIIDTAKY